MEWCRNKKAIRCNVCTITKLHIIITINRIAVIIVSRVHLITDSVTIRACLRISIRCSKVKSETKFLCQRSCDWIVISFLTTISNHIGIRTLLWEKTALVTRSQFYVRSSIPKTTQVCYYCRIIVTAIYSLKREVNVKWKFSIQSQWSLPCRVHLKISVNNCWIRWSSHFRIKSQILKLVRNWNMEIRLTTSSICSLIVIISILTTTRVTYSRYKPHKRKTSNIVSSTSTQNKWTVAKNIPIEAYTWWNCQRFAWKLVCSIANFVSAVLLKLNCGKGLIIIILESGIHRNLKTKSCSHSKSIREIQLILKIEWQLIILHLWFKLALTIHRECNSICGRFSIIIEIIKWRINIISTGCCTKSIYSLISFKLKTCQEIMNSCWICCLISCNKCLNFSKVTCSKRIWTKRCINSTIL